LRCHRKAQGTENLADHPAEMEHAATHLDNRELKKEILGESR
jgi:hypothetical protein